MYTKGLPDDLGLHEVISIESPSREVLIGDTVVEYGQ